MKKKIIFLLAVFVVLFASIFTFESLSRKYQRWCSRPFSRGGLSCWALKEKYGVPEVIPLLFFEVKAKREAGEKVLKKDYRKLMEEVVLEVEREEIGGSNGIACGYFGFVARDLLKPAKRFVKRHELVHILGIGSNFKANMEAGKEYPFGFLETTILSIFRALIYSEKPFVCRIVSLWNNFKEYFLPF